MSSLAAANLFKDHYKLDPGYVQVLNSFIGLPWGFKIFYGLISDNFPIFGSKRRSYCILLSAMQLTVSLMLAAYQGTEEKISAFFLLIISLTVAANDVIVDSIMVI